MRNDNYGEALQEVIAAADAQLALMGYNHNIDYVKQVYESVGMKAESDGSGGRYKVTLSLPKARVRITYKASRGVNVEKNRVLDCFISDALAVENCKDIDTFASEFGYTTISECLEAYKGCKRANAQAKKLFGNVKLWHDLNLYMNAR